jgi:hypothetical protein
VVALVVLGLLAKVTMAEQVLITPPLVKLVVVAVVALERLERMLVEQLVEMAGLGQLVL